MTSHSIETGEPYSRYGLQDRQGIRPEMAIRVPAGIDSSSKKCYDKGS